MLLNKSRYLGDQSASIKKAQQLQTYFDWHTNGYFWVWRHCYMPYVITEPCVGTCDGACVDVCPVDCIAGPPATEELAKLSPDARKEAAKGLQLYINPDECIDCGACAPECPVEAIYDEYALPDKWDNYRQLNADFFKA